MSLPSINRDRLSAVLMLLPSVILLAIFVYGFIGRTAYDSLTDWEGVAENVQKKFVGADNYEKLFTGLSPSLVKTFPEMEAVFFITMTTLSAPALMLEAKPGWNPSLLALIR